MFKIADGRDCLYQWDIGDKLNLIGDGAAEIDELHFCHVQDREQFTVAVDHTGDVPTAEVPNILLQSSQSIIVYAYCRGDGAEYTRCDAVIQVKPRKKPADYVNEETEILNYKELAEKFAKELEEIKGSSGGGDGSETDTIPDALPNPHKLIFTGAVTEEYDGSEEVTVEIPSGDESSGESSGESEWRLLNTVTITEETSLIEFTTDSDGNPFEVSEVYLYFDVTTYATAAGTFYFRPNRKSIYNMSQYGFINTTAGNNFQRHLHAKNIAHDRWRCEFVMNTGHGVPLFVDAGKTITSFSITGQTLVAGTIYAYGR